MEIRSCYHCGSAERTFYAEENGYSLVKCTVCGLIYLEERPDDQEISEAHKQGKHRGNKDLEVTGAFNEKIIPRYLSILDDIFHGNLENYNTWLDVGCGHGEFMAAVQTYSADGVVVKGTEPNIDKQKSARENGLDVGYFDLATHEEKYDVISLLNVYSHLPDPPAFLNSLKNLLNPQGEVILETGDTANLSAKEHYRPFSLPDHLSFASEEIVVDILQRLDFEIISINKYPYLPLNLKSVLKESAKAILPQYKSRFRYFFNWKRYSQTDMFIRARLKKHT